MNAAPGASKWAGVGIDAEKEAARRRDSDAIDLAREIRIHGGDDVGAYDALAAAYTFLDACDALLSEQEPEPKHVEAKGMRFHMNKNEIEAYRRAQAARKAGGK